MRGSLLLLSALLLLESTDGKKEYQLGQRETNIIIDKAIKEANERHGKAKHLDFASILNSDYDKRMLNVLLKPTTCDKTIPFVHRKDCKIQNKATPQVSCVECRGEMSCFLLREQEKIKQTVSKCLHPPKRSPITGVELCCHKQQEMSNKQEMINKLHVWDACEHKKRLRIFETGYMN
ncbi:cystatin-like protein isoform X2 [Ctenopharyngodon idella]|uniref:cystatin-like protein isoform X2 n=1 Tax=Ctenopharyngodon idella TaxID=7959 RepID=UPI00222EA8EF|nr:cystatin-like protein isoform X2 [Ctenopharyngodon idella]